MNNKTKEIRFIELTCDTTFKYLYKDERFRPWFNNIIKNIFNIDLEGYTLIDTELNTGNRIKDYRLDIKLLKDDVTVILEMNNSTYDYNYIDKKNYQYLFREAGNSYDKGEDYTNKKVKLILFNNYKNKQLSNLKHCNLTLNDPVNNRKIDDIESFEIYLPNFKKICYHVVNQSDISLSLFTCESYAEMREKTNNPKDLEIIKELERLAMDEAFMRNYDEEQVYIKTQNSIKRDAHQVGYDEGIIQGKSQEKINIAKSMINDNIEINIISKYTGLSCDEIKKLK